MGNDFFLGNTVNPGDDLLDLSADALPPTNGLIDVNSLRIETEAEQNQQVRSNVVQDSNQISKYVASAGMMAVAALVFGVMTSGH